MGSLQLEWRDQVIAYAQRINEYVARGLTVGWDEADEEPPEPDLNHLVAPLLEALREANRSGTWGTLREEWPPAHGPLIPWLKEHGQGIPVVNFLPDGKIVARIGSYYHPGKTVQIDGDSVVDLPTVGFFGRSSNRKYFAFARSDGIDIREGWDGARVTFCPWPTGLEDLPEGFEVAPFAKPPLPIQLVPFPDGRRVLLVSGEGIFVLDEFKARRLLPTTPQLRDHFSWVRTTYPGDPLIIHLDMAHGAVSQDGKLIAVGEQSSQHLVFDASLDLLAEVSPASEYPHFAIFSEDDSMVALNSCHMYNGTTIGVATRELAAASPDEVKSFPLQDGARVYAALSRRDEFIAGDAGGYLRAFGTDGEFQWQHFIGSSVGAMDISADGKTLAVSTYAGFLSIIRLDAGRQQPYQIGNGNHLEERRWVFWKDESPLIW